MIQFMVLAAPRSGTAWAANWLTTDTTLAIHDPLWRFHYDRLDSLDSQRMLGVSCTGLALFPHFVKEHPARKVILHRPIPEINSSLASMGMPMLNPNWDQALKEIEGMHVHWEDLFVTGRAAPIYEFLLDRKFDAERHRELIDLNVQMNFGSIKINREESVRLFQDLQRIQKSLA